MSAWAMMKHRDAYMCRLSKCEYFHVRVFIHAAGSEDVLHARRFPSGVDKGLNKTCESALFQYFRRFRPVVDIDLTNYG